MGPPKWHANVRIGSLGVSGGCVTEGDEMSVLLEKHANGVAIVTLNRPQVLNALDVPAKERLGEIWQEIAADDQVRVAVLRGAGDQGVLRRLRHQGDQPHGPDGDVRCADPCAARRRHRARQTGDRGAKGYCIGMG